MNPLRDVIHDLAQDQRELDILERQPTRQHLVHQDAEGIDVRAGIDGARVDDLLRGHEVGGPENRARARRAAGGFELRDPEVDDLDLVAAINPGQQEHVVGLQVAMNDPRRVGRLQRRRDLHRDVAGARDRQHAVLFDLRREGHPVEKLHDEIRAAVIERSEIRALDDVRVPEVARGAPLVDEAIDHLRVVDAVVQDLDGDTATKDEVMRLVDGPHASDPDHTIDLVRTDRRADSQIGARP